MEYIVSVAASKKNEIRIMQKSFVVAITVVAVAVAAAAAAAPTAAAVAVAALKIQWG